jgi:hypothetical protein
MCGLARTLHTCHVYVLVNTCAIVQMFVYVLINKCCLFELSVSVYECTYACIMSKYL